VTLPLAMYAQLPILIVVISLVYSATKFDRWDLILRDAFRWGSRMAVFLLAIGAVLFLVTSFLDAR
jgi:hypothetical protein